MVGRVARCHFLSMSLVSRPARIPWATVPAVRQAPRSPTSPRLPPRPSRRVGTRPGRSNLPLLLAPLPPYISLLQVAERSGQLEAHSLLPGRHPILTQLDIFTYSTLITVACIK